MPMNIFLVGFMASGKTTLGSQLATLLGMRYVDMDEYIEQVNGDTIRKIFVTKGEEYFRKLENEALIALAKEDEMIIATGGGSACFHSNIDVMNANGLTVYLKVSTEELVRRLADTKIDRPLLWGKSTDELTVYITEMLKIRDPHYTKAKVIFPSDNPLATDIVAVIKPYLK